jgi:ribosome-associated protein
MDIRKLQRAIVDGLEDVKAQHIAVFNTEHLSALFERVIVASGTSNRQTKALAASVREAVKSRGMEVLSVEGEDNGEWIIVDCGAAVAHIMQPAIREYYHLEEIWGGKAVRLKVGEVSTRLVKASEPEPAAKPAVKRAAPRKAANPDKATQATKSTRSNKASREAVELKASNRTAAFKRVAAKAPRRPARESTAPATQTIVVKPAGAKPAGKPAAQPAAKKVARKAAVRPAAKKAAAAPRKTAARKTAPRAR